MTTETRTTETTAATTTATITSEKFGIGIEFNNINRAKAAEIINKTINGTLTENDILNIYVIEDQQGRKDRLISETCCAFYERSTALEAENKAFMLKLRDATLSAIEETRFAMIVGRLRDSTEAKITGHVQDVVELTSKTYGLNQGEQESILDYLVAGGDLSLYGLSNAVTRASQDIESYDRATALENIGWQVVTMSPKQWHEFNRC